MKLYGEWNCSGPVEPLSMRLILPLCGLLICAACARGEDLALSATVVAPPPSLHRVEVKASPVAPEVKDFGWRIKPKAGTKVAGKPTAELLVFEAPPGEYEVSARRTIDGFDDIATVKVVVGKPGPDPGPQPPPDPLPPKDAKIVIVVVENESAPAESRGAYVNNTAILDRCNAKGHTWRLVSDKSEAGDVQRFIAKAKGKNLPQYFLVNQADGKTLGSGDMPATPEAFLAAITKAGG